MVDFRIHVPGGDLALADGTVVMHDSGDGTFVPCYLSSAGLVEILPAVTTCIVVAPYGDDAGLGSWLSPYKTLTKAFTVWNATRHTIYALAGDYAEAATLTWPNVSGLTLEAVGPVTVSNANGAAQVLLIAPTYTAGSFGATIKGALNLDANTQIGLKIANAAMTRKLNVYLDGLSAEQTVSGDSIDVAGTVAGQAVRVYARNMNLEGLLHFTVNDAGSRLRIQNAELVGGLTTAGAVASEVTLRNVQVLTGALTVAAQQKLTNVACVYATDADPAVYTVLADAFATYS